MVPYLPLSAVCGDETQVPTPDPLDPMTDREDFFGESLMCGGWTSTRPSR
jgi:hypothetical protein